MGQEAAVVNRSRRISSASQGADRALRLKIDVPLLLVTITLVVFGTLMVYSASWDISFRFTDEPTQLFNRQLMWLGLGLSVMAGLIWLDYRIWRHLVVWAMLGTVIALIVVLFIGESADGVTRTLRGNSYQPSELAKLMIVLYLSVWLYAKRDYLSDVHFGLIPLAAIIGIVSGLIFSQPDLSAGATIIILGGIMFFIAGGDLRQISFLLVVAIVVGLIIARFNLTGSERVGSFWAGLKDPSASSEHVQHSLAAISRGGWFGVGIGQGKMKLIVLPVPHTDSVFAVVGEEFGVVGAALVVSLFGLLLWRGLVIARRAPDGLGSLMAAGISVWIAMEAFMNMLALTGLMPFAGNPLPFFSIGGSSLVFTLAGVGTLLNISRLSEQKQLEEERRSFGALIDLRRWDRRRRVSRAQRHRTFGR